MFDGDDALDEQESRIQELKRQAEQTSGGETFAVPRPVPQAPPNVLDPNVREQFWASALAHNDAPLKDPSLNDATSTSEFEQLRRQGVELPPPEQLDDDAVARKIDEIAGAMRRRNVFLGDTDGLSGRALYEQLYHETLHEARPIETRPIETHGDLPAASAALFSYDPVDPLAGPGNPPVPRSGAADDDDASPNVNDPFPTVGPPPPARDPRLPRRSGEPLIDDELPMDDRWLGEDTVR
jgi:hypothetical protein